METHTVCGPPQREQPPRPAAASAPPMATAPAACRGTATADASMPTVVAATAIDAAAPRGWDSAARGTARGCTRASWAGCSHGAGCASLGCTFCVIATDCAEERTVSEETCAPSPGAG